MDLFEQCLELNPDERRELLRRSCARDEDLSHEVESLLRYDDVDSRDLDDGLARDALASDFIADLETEEIPKRIASYEITGELGRGGMGLIYDARQESPKRRVALKVLRGGLMNASTLRRFQREAQVLGHLKHAGIALVHEAGIAEINGARRPYFAMEFVEGLPITEHADQEDLCIRQRLELLARVCDAVEYAHRKGVIHRDLKPGNVLIVRGADESQMLNNTNGYASDPIGQPKVLDFGIARVVDADIDVTHVQTEAGQIIGTLAYMSPEQVAGDPGDVDTRCDVFSLGAIAYELLSGTPARAVTDLSVHEAIRIVRDEQPAPLANIDRSLAGDVGTIVAKALERDPVRRYGSASSLAADIRRFLANQPIEARPASTLYQLSRFTRRNRPLVIGVAATLAMLIVGLAGTSAGLLRAEAARKQTAQANSQLETVIEFLPSMISGVDAPTLGLDLLKEIYEQVEHSLVAQGVPRPVIDRRLAQLQRELGSINAADLGLVSVRRGVLDPSSSAVLSQFDDRPLVRAILQRSLGATYLNLGFAPQAEKEYVRAIAEMESAEDSTSQVLLSTRLEHAATIRQQRPTEALESLNNILARMRAIDDADQLLMLQILIDLGATHRAVGNLDAAALHADEAMSLANSLGDKADTLAIEALELRAGIHSDTAELDEAHAVYLHVLDEGVRLYGVDSDAVIRARNNLGNILLRRGDPAQAEPHLRAALAGLESRYGTDHPTTLVAKNNLGGLLASTGDFETALDLHAEIADTHRRLRGHEHPDTLRSMKNIGGMLYMVGRHDEALEQLHEVHEIRIKVLGEAHPATLADSLTIGTIILDSGQTERAIVELQHAHDLAAASLTATHRTRVGIGLRLLRALEAQGQWRQLKALARDCRMTWPNDFWPHHEASAMLALAMLRLGSQEDAAAAYNILSRSLAELTDQTPEPPPQDALIGRIRELLQEAEGAVLLPEADDG